jgi:23S rRNA pseudouridine1911/1915/1917 synthase
LRQFTAEKDEKLLAFLVESGVKRTAAKIALKFGAVAVNGAVVRQWDHPLAPGDVVTVGGLQQSAAAGRLKAAKIEIVHEDDALLVIEKPAGLLTVATDRDKTDTLFFRLLEFLQGRDGARAARPQVVHRLDQETSGLVLFAKSPAVKTKLQAEWPAVEKTYLAIAEGTPDPAEGTITSYLTETKALRVYSHDGPTPEAKLATTRYRVVRTKGGHSLVEIGLETGRKHQIRVHLADLGHPVAGDARYGAQTDPAGRLALHAARLALTHPVTGARLVFTSSLPKPLARIV